MEKNSTLSQQVEAYHDWKKGLNRLIRRYQSWLQENQLRSDDMERRIQRGLQLLEEDELTIAFVGEYSRGKTELINALFFSQYGQRMLPSQAGRTTMCPTELFFDRTQNSSYLLLLPIETRKDEDSLQTLKSDHEAWVRHDLNDDDSDQVRTALAQVAQVKSVSREEAAALGFDDDSLETDRANPTQVLVPRWRHAQISIRHNLFEQGLRILDTPGLNALGSEPELTISMLPGAQAIIFLLSADTGVTASDMTIWNDYIALDSADHRAGRFAVLNKIDVLWDDLQGEEHTRKAIEDVQTYTAEHLGIQVGDVIPVSAKQALLARVRSDEQLYQRSALGQLETLLSDRILMQKERLLSQNLIRDLLSMLQTSQNTMQNRLDSLIEERESYSVQSIDKASLNRLAQNAQQDYEFYNRHLITLRSSRKLVQSQGIALSKLVSPQRFDEHVRTIERELASSWTTAGMNRAMSNFFETLEADFSNLLAEGHLADKMVAGIYRRYNEDSKGRTLEPMPFRLGRHVLAVRSLRKKASKFRWDVRNMLSEQTVVIRRFTNILVSEARALHDRARADVERWPDEALLPIMQYSREQKQMLEHQIGRIRDLIRNQKDARTESRRLDQDIAFTRKQLQLAAKMQRQFRKPAPTVSQQKVVAIGGH